MAFDQPPHTETDTLDDSIFTDGVKTILRTGGIKPTRRTEQRRDDILIKSNQAQANPSHNRNLLASPCPHAPCEFPEGLFKAKLRCAGAGNDREIVSRVLVLQIQSETLPE